MGEQACRAGPASPGQRSQDRSRALGSPGKQAGQGSSGNRKSLVGMDWREEGSPGGWGEGEGGTDRGLGIAS